MSPDSDAELLVRIQNGEPRAFEQLFRRYVAPLCGFAYRYLGEHAMAEEVVQDVFLAIWQRQTSWDPKGTVKSYLFLAVRNRAFQVLERKRTELNYKDELLQQEPSHAAHTHSPEHVLTDQERAAAVQHAIASLPERARLVFTLHREQELTYREIAEVLEISVKTVESQMSRALKLLRDRLSEIR